MCVGCGLGRAWLGIVWCGSDCIVMWVWMVVAGDLVLRFGVFVCHVNGVVLIDTISQGSESLAVDEGYNVGFVNDL